MFLAIPWAPLLNTSSSKWKVPLRLYNSFHLNIYLKIDKISILFSRFKHFNLSITLCVEIYLVLTIEKETSLILFLACGNLVDKYLPCLRTFLSIWCFCLFIINSPSVASHKQPWENSVHLFLLQVGHEGRLVFDCLNIVCLLRIIFNYQLIIISTDNFSIFSCLCIILYLILSSQRFWWISFCQFYVFSLMKFKSFLFYFYVLFTVQIFLLYMLK